MIGKNNNKWSFNRLPIVGWIQFIGQLSLNGVDCWRWHRCNKVTSRYKKNDGFQTKDCLLSIKTENHRNWYRKMSSQFEAHSDGDCHGRKTKEKNERKTCTNRMFECIAELDHHRLHRFARKTILVHFFLIQTNDKQSSFSIDIVESLAEASWKKKIDFDVVWNSKIKPLLWAFYSFFFSRLSIRKYFTIKWIVCIWDSFIGSLYKPHNSISYKGIKQKKKAFFIICLFSFVQLIFVKHFHHLILTSIFLLILLNQSVFHWLQGINTCMHERTKWIFV